MDKDKRIEELLRVILKYTKQDFSEKAHVGEAGDEIDAIAAGVNALVEELQATMEAEQQRSRELSAVNKELEAFSYSVSHDLRAPLRAIDGFAGILEEDYAPKLDDEGKRLLTVVKDSAVKMGELIDNLLEFSRLGKREVQRLKVDMRSLAESIWIDITKGGTGKCKLELGPLHFALADRALVSQVFFNLISNAIKYSSKSADPRVEISSKEEQGETIFCVKDNGAGFDMKYSHKLFGVFQRLHSPKDFEGTGVGLAIVQRIIIKHGGRVWAEAVVGEGAKFYFSLPLK